MRYTRANKILARFAYLLASVSVPSVINRINSSNNHWSTDFQPVLAVRWDSQCSRWEAQCEYKNLKANK